MKRFRSILAYEAEWNQSELTEQHALTQAMKLLPQVPAALYIGFPWATLIDRLNIRESSASKLKDVVNGVKHILYEQKYVVTVCQHVDMLKYQKIFKDSGITHVFWAHAVKGQNCFPENENIKIFPFPIFPVHASSYAPSNDAARRYLYSYVETQSQNRALGESSRIILANLSNHQNSLVIPYLNEVFSGSRMHCKKDSNQQLVDDDASFEIENILQKSIFSLCPSGTGPNSIRLWESIGCGSIPVVLSDDYLPPVSNAALWEQAIVSCPERLEDIVALPDRLAKMAHDEELLERKRHAMRQLWMIYGPDCFIYDIHKMFLSFAGENANLAGAQPTFSYGSLYYMATEINTTEKTERSLADVFVLGCNSRVLFDPSGFLARYQDNDDFRTAYHLALLSCSPEHAESMANSLEFKQIILDNISHT